MPKRDNISMSVIRRLPRYYRFLSELKDNGVVRISSRELSDKMGFTGADKDNFVATVARYNELYDKQNDEDFGKPASRLSAIRTAPFYGCWLGASLLCSMQGISITENCQAKDSNNEPIPGLYITGDMSGSFFQNNYPCVMGGTACGRTLTFAIKSVKQMAGLENA